MASGQGTVELDFGAFPGVNEASVAVTGQATILGTSKAEAYMMGDDTSTDYTAADVRWLSALVGLTCGTPTVGVGFTVYGRSTEQLQGKIPLRYVWSD